MNKPVTEKDFENKLSDLTDNWGCSYMSDVWGKETFELAKRMAIDFATWLDSDEGFVGDGVERTTEQLFELYQQQKQ